MDEGGQAPGAGLLEAKISLRNRQSEYAYLAASAGFTTSIPGYREKPLLSKVRIDVRPWTCMAATRRASCAGFPEP